MKSLFGYQDTLEAMTNVVQILQENAIDAQINLHKDVKRRHWIIGYESEIFF
jgi:hypothetical protein